MGWADWLFAAIMAGLLLRGLFAGLVNEALGLVGVILAYMAASVLYTPLGRLFAADVAGFDLSGPIAFIAVFIVLLVGVHFLAHLLTALIDSSIVGWLNHLGGAVLGLLKGVLVCAAVVLLIHRLPSGPETRRELSAGPVSRPVSAVAEPLAGLVGALADDDAWWRPGLEEALGVRDGEWELLDNK